MAHQQQQQRESNKKDDTSTSFHGRARIVALTLTRCTTTNCGFYGTPATRNMCISCFRAERPANADGLPWPAPESGGVGSPEEEKEVRRRCSGCGKKVGLTGFRCRCGEVFCGVHRYSDRHDCRFDYRAAGREAIARENPVVRAAKIVRI